MFALINVEIVDFPYARRFLTVVRNDSGEWITTKWGDYVLDSDYLNIINMLMSPARGAAFGNICGKPYQHRL